MLAEAEDRARTRGARKMEMTVIGQREELIDWYLRRGYAGTHERRPFPYHLLAPAKPNATTSTSPSSSRHWTDLASRADEVGGMGNDFR
ncbi:MAG: hypothetical protein JWM76_2864 [Pseudonocardiales bacterium]|nr:hypothetical protein [Pseudonocardiales bacterium]